MRTIPECTNLPNGTPVDAVQGRLKVFERRPVNGKYGPTTVQKASLSDVADNRIRLEVWGHPDLIPMDGMEVVVFAGGKGGKGLSIKHGSYKKADTGEVINTIVNTIELNVSKLGQFQTVEIYRSTVAPSTVGPIAAIPANPSHSAAPAGSGQLQTVQIPLKGQETAPPGKVAIRGDAVGMAINNAVNIIVALAEQGQVPGDLMKDIGQKASDIIRLSNWLQQGNLYPEVKKEPAKPVVVKQPDNDKVPF